MKVLLFATAYNGMCQRVDRELLRQGVEVFIELSPLAADMEQAVVEAQPDLILCPFLKHRVPETIWRDFPCLIVHPGIEGDRGPSSLDWAISQDWSYWGVTLLQADAEMDAGDIWGTAEFPLRRVGKASVYRREVISHGIQLIKAALDQYQDSGFRPRALDYSRSEVRGCWQPVMPQAEREVNWQEDDTETVVRKIRAADGFPGVLDVIEGHRFYLYGARAGKNHWGAPPGSIVGQAEGAICRATRDGSVWIRQMKRAPAGDQRFFKLPALQALYQSPLAEHFSNLPCLEDNAVKEIHTHIEGPIAYITFDFYNGAMNTAQCRALLAELRALRHRSDLRVLVLMGGQDFWSNGIHLNCIEAADNPARESWLNINAIDDVVHEIVTNDRQLTVAALRNNAGAGGAILPLACDRILGRSGVVLNPHYQTMGLYGSEYWTYLLPRRVGSARAQAITNQCLPLLTDDAQSIGMIDRLLPEDWEEYHQGLYRYCQSLAASEPDAEALAEIGGQGFEFHLAEKNAVRARDEGHRPLADYRADELRRMKAVFYDPDSDYHRLRYQFVHKISCGKTPERLKRGPASVGKAVSA